MSDWSEDKWEQEKLGFIAEAAELRTRTTPLLDLIHQGLKHENWIHRYLEIKGSDITGELRSMFDSLGKTFLRGSREAPIIWTGVRRDTEQHSGVVGLLQSVDSYTNTIIPSSQMNGGYYLLLVKCIESQVRLMEELRESSSKVSNTESLIRASVGLVQLAGVLIREYVPLQNRIIKHYRLKDEHLAAVVEAETTARRKDLDNRLNTRFAAARTLVANL